MTFVKLENGFTYDKEVLDTIKTAKRYERQRQATLREAANLTPEQAGWARFGAWKMGQRESTFSGFHDEQRLEIHTTAHVYCSRPTPELDQEVCTCGLVSEVSRGDFEPDFIDPLPKPNERPGHIRVSDKTLQTLFVIHEPNGAENGEARYCFFCQTCGVIAEAPISDSRAESPESTTMLNELRNEHICTR
jgi:hypothetical protein